MKRKTATMPKNQKTLSLSKQARPNIRHADNVPKWQPEYTRTVKESQRYRVTDIYREFKGKGERKNRSPK